MVAPACAVTLVVEPEPANVAPLPMVIVPVVAVPEEL